MKNNRTIILASFALMACAVLMFGILVFAHLSVIFQRLLIVGLITDVIAVICLAGYSGQIRRIEAVDSTGAAEARAEITPRLAELSNFISTTGARIGAIDQSIGLRPGCLGGPSIHALSSARRILEGLEERLEVLTELLSRETAEEVQTAALEYERPLKFPVDKIHSVNDQQIPDLLPGQWTEVMDALLSRVESDVAGTKRTAGGAA